MCANKAGDVCLCKIQYLSRTLVTGTLGDNWYMCVVGNSKHVLLCQLVSSYFCVSLSLSLSPCLSLFSLSPSLPVSLSSLSRSCFSLSPCLSLFSLSPSLPVSLSSLSRSCLSLLLRLSLSRQQQWFSPSWLVLCHHCSGPHLLPRVRHPPHTHTFSVSTPVLKALPFPLPLP